MHVRDLEVALGDIKTLLEASGAIRQAQDIANVLESIEGRSEQELTEFLGSLRDELSPVLKHVTQLRTAGLDEAQFQAAFSALKEAKLQKPMLLQIAEKFIGSVDTSLPKDKILKAISTHFFVRVYERDSREMAKRATPW